MAKLIHSSTRRGFSTHNSVGTDSLSNPNVTGGIQPGMIELKTTAGVPYYLWTDTSGNLRIHSSFPTTPESVGSSLGCATTASAIADYVITWSSNEPTAGSAATIADGTVVGDANEGGQAIADLTAKVNLILAALRSNGIIAT